MPDLAKAFYSLHEQNEFRVLPNAWDAASAKVIENSRTKAIASSSAGVAWALGFPNGDVLLPRILAELTARITSILKIPLSVDFERGITTSLSANR